MPDRPTCGCPLQDRTREPTVLVFHGVSPAHLQAYLDEYCYRLNRREKREDIFRRLLNRCMLYGAPAPYSLLTGT